MNPPQTLAEALAWMLEHDEVSMDSWQAGMVTETAVSTSQLRNGRWIDRYGSASHPDGKAAFLMAVQRTWQDANR